MSWHFDLPEIPRLVALEITDSTNVRAKDLAAEGAEHLTLVIARNQTAARGRLNRPWVAQEGNVYWSIILRPSAHWPALGTLPFVSALSVRKALERLTGGSGRFSIKWPNDVLLDRKKISGILHESAGPVRAGSGSWVVVGIGINVESHPEGALLYPSASLRSAGFPGPSRDQVIAELTRTFVATLSQWTSGGYAAIRDDLVSAMIGFGERIVVRKGTNPKDHLTGVFKALDEEGYLLLETDSGRTERIVVGDIFLS
jgi:BirA family transcriptional regulator, biotin operon repressor / biotin---[acetyl-CoA-carboxylase] ligase